MNKLPPINVIPSYRSRYQSKASMSIPLVNNINLHFVSHLFRVIAEC